MASLTLEVFLQEFPEFDTADAALVIIKLAQAHRSFDEVLLGASFLDAVGYKTAELLALSPYGKSSRLSDKTAETTYRIALEDILGRVPSRGMAVW